MATADDSIVAANNVFLKPFLVKNSQGSSPLLRSASEIISLFRVSL